MTTVLPSLWLNMTFKDADRMMGWLSEVGFVALSTLRSDRDKSVVEHAEWLWPECGGVMFGSERSDSQFTNAGMSMAYLVTSTPDAVFDRAVAAGAVVQRPMSDQPFGARTGTCLDPEGNFWAIGNYQPS